MDQFIVYYLRLVLFQPRVLRPRPPRPPLYGLEKVSITEFVRGKKG